MKAELVLGNLKREREALEGKLERLNVALGKDWEDETQEYLCTQQFNTMSLYAHILDERIADIEYKLEEKKMAAKEASSHETSHTDEKTFRDIDFACYKNCGDTACNDADDTCDQDQCEDEDDAFSIIKDMLEDIFNIKIILC